MWGRQGKDGKVYNSQYKMKYSLQSIIVCCINNGYKNFIDIEMIK